MSEFTVSRPQDNALGTIVNWNMLGVKVRGRDPRKDVPPITCTGIGAAALPKGALPVMLAKQRALDPNGTGPGFTSYEGLANVKYAFPDDGGRALRRVVAELYKDDREYLNRLKMHRWRGISQRSAGIIKPSRSQDYVAARPRSGLLVLGDGAGGTRDGAEACRLAVRTFADTFADTGEDSPSYQRAPGDLGHAGKRLWVAAEAADQAIANAKTRGSMASDAATTLVAVVANEGGLTAFNAGDSRALWATPRGGRALTSEQSGGQFNNELYNAFLGTGAERQHSTALTGNSVYGVDEIVRYPWAQLIQPGERGSVALYSDGLGGDAAYEAVKPSTLGRIAADHLHDSDAGAIAWRLVEAGLKIDDRAALVGNFVCHSS